MVGGMVFEDPQKKIVRKHSAAAAQASALAVAAALNLYVDAPDDKKPAALEKLMNVAKFTETNWPDRPEADDARMARGQAKLVVRQVREAIDIFERVNPKSDRYPLAMYRAGQNYAALYWMEEKKPEKGRNSEQMAADRAKAIQRLQAGLAILNREVEPGKPLPKYFADTQLLLAEIRSEGGEMKQAAALYQPLVDAIKAEKPQESRRHDAPRFPRRRAGVLPPWASSTRPATSSAVLIDLGPDTLAGQRRADRVRQAVGLGAEEGRGGRDGVGKHHEERAKCDAAQDAVGVGRETARQDSRQAGQAAESVAGRNGVHRRRDELRSA